MQVKTFTGASSQEVLAQVKAELGPDAVILGNRSFRRNGVVCHEITAGIDRGQASEASAPSAPTPPGWGEWHREWLKIKDNLFALMKPAIQLERLSPRQRVALEYLQREGVCDEVAVELYKRLLADPEASVLECLGQTLPVKPWSAENWPERVHLLCGPYGAGKTSTALRLAMLRRQADPALRIAFVNADCLRGNGRLILRHWAELSNFAYLEAGDRESMCRALNTLKGAQLIFIDCPGLGREANFTDWREEMGLGVNFSESSASHLTLNPFSTPEQYQDFLRRYHNDGSASLIWTKLDESVNFGNLVNVAHNTKLPVAALSFGAELKQSLAPASESLVWRLIFKRQLPQGQKPAKKDAKLKSSLSGRTV